MVDDDKAKKNGDGNGKNQEKKKEPAVNDVDKKKMNKPKVDKPKVDEKAQIEKGKKKRKDKKKKKKRGDKMDKDKKNKKKEKKEEGKVQAEAEEEDDDEELEKDEKVNEQKKKPVKKEENAKGNKDEKRAKQKDSNEDEQVLSTGTSVSGGANRETDSSSEDSDELTDDLDRDVEEQDNNRTYAASVQIEDFIKHEPEKVESSVSVPLVQNLTVAPTALPKCDSPQKVDSGPNVASHRRVTYSRNLKSEKASNMNDGSGKLASGSTTSKSVESTVPVTQGKQNLPEAKASEAVAKPKSEPLNKAVNSEDNPSTQVSKQKE